MTEEQEALLMKDRIRELRFTLKREPTPEEIQVSIRQRPINFKKEGVTDLTDLAVNPKRTVPKVGFREDPGDAPNIVDLNNEVMMLAEQADGGEPNGLVQALNATKADDPKPTFARDAEDLADEGTEVIKFNYLEDQKFPHYYPITPLKQNVETSGSLTFDEKDIISAETPAQKRERINQTRKTVLSDPGIPEVVEAPKPISPISDMSTVSENVDLLSKHGIPFEEISGTEEEEVERKNIAEVIAKNIADVITPESEKEVIPQDKDPQKVVQETIKKNEEIVKNQQKKTKEKGEVVTTEEGLVIPEDGVITSVTETLDSPESVVETETTIEGAPAKTLVKSALKTTSSLPQDTEMVQLTDLMKLLDAGGLNKDIVNAVLESPGYDMMFEKGIEKEKVDLINAEIKANNKRLEGVASKKIKPFFGEKDTGRKFMAAIAAGLGAYASAMTGTKNFALDIINQAIETDLLKQKEQLERERLSILDQNKILESRKAELYTVAQIQIKDAMAKAGDERDKQKLVVALEQIQQKNKEARIALGAEIVKANATKKQSLNNRYVPGFGVTQYTDPTLYRDIVKEAHKAVRSETKIKTHMETARNILKGKDGRGKFFAAIPLSTERQRLQSALAEIANQYRQKELELGTQFTQFEGPFLDRIIDKEVRWKDLAFSRIEKMLNNLEIGLKAKRKGLMQSGRFIPTNAEESQTEPQLNINPGLKTGS